MPWLTYRELAEHLGTSHGAAKMVALRRGWQRQPPNRRGGIVRVLVPDSIDGSHGESADHVATTVAGGVRGAVATSVRVVATTADLRQPLDHAPDVIPVAVHNKTIEAFQATHEAALERLERKHREHAEQLRTDITNLQSRHDAETARRLAERDSLHLGHIERLLAQAGIERSLWLERVDAAELRAERVEQRLDQVLDQLLAGRHQLPVSHFEQGDRLPWYQRWFGSTTKSNLRRG